MDWRQAEAYLPLITADRSLHAWEWLRRDRHYRAAAEAGPGAGAGASEQWGLHAFVPPGLAAPAARPLWSASVHPYILAAHAVPAQKSCDAFDARLLAGLVAVSSGVGGRQHVLICDGYRAIRIDLLSGRIDDGPVELSYCLSGLASAEKPLLVLRRMIAIARSGRFARSLHPPDPRARRLMLLLRAHDAVCAGAGQREIAAVLLGREAGAARWRSRVPSLRSQAQRLVRGARAMAAGGYLTLLR